MKIKSKLLNKAIKDYIKINKCSKEKAFNFLKTHGSKEIKEEIYKIDKPSFMKELEVIAIMGFEADDVFDYLDKNLNPTIILSIKELLKELMDDIIDKNID